MAKYSIYTLTPNDSNHQDDLVYELKHEIIDGESFDVNCYLNDEISKPNHGIFCGAKFVEVRNIVGHAIKKSTQIDCSDVIEKFESNMQDA